MHAEISHAARKSDLGEQEVIDKLADDLDASLTIVGTAARRTIGKLLVGNTAEEIIGRTTRDLVTVHAPS